MTPRVCVGSIELPASALAWKGRLSSVATAPGRCAHLRARFWGRADSCTVNGRVTADRFAAPESRHRLRRRFRGPKPVTTVRIVAAESEHPARRRSTTALQSHATVTQRTIDPHKPEENPDSCSSGSRPPGGVIPSSSMCRSLRRCSTTAVTSGCSTHAMTAPSSATGPRSFVRLEQGSSTPIALDPVGWWLRGCHTLVQDGAGYQAEHLDFEITWVNHTCAPHVTTG